MLPVNWLEIQNLGLIPDLLRNFEDEAWQSVLTSFHVFDSNMLAKVLEITSLNQVKQEAD